MTKKDKLEKHVLKCIDTYGFKKIEDKGRDFCVIDTPLGVLRIGSVESDRKLSCIFMRFENHVYASKFVECNPYTGKWNIMLSTLEDAERSFDMCMCTLYRLCL